MTVEQPYLRALRCPPSWCVKRALASAKPSLNEYPLRSGIQTAFHEVASMSKKTSVHDLSNLISTVFSVFIWAMVWFIHGVMQIRLLYLQLVSVMISAVLAMGIVQEHVVSYTRVCETSAGCLRSIYPSLGMRQLFGDVTMGQWRHN